MRQQVTYTDKQLKEIKEFHIFCKEEVTDLDNYSKVCDTARQYHSVQEYKGIVVESPISLLSLSAIVQERGDELSEVIVRDLNNSKSVRLNHKLINAINKTKDDICQN